MLLKIAFTVAVIVGVVVFFRGRARAAEHVDDHADTSDPAEAGRSVSPRALVYGLLGALAGGSVLWFEIERRAGERIVDIRVISDNTSTEYRARRKSIAGRSFTTVDGARITIGTDARIEMNEQ